VHYSRRYNLKFGAQFKHPDPAAWDVEIYNLLKQLGVSEELIGKTAEEFCLGPHAKKYTLIGLNGERLSMTNRALLSMARALLSSVDLLLMSNVLDLLGPAHAKKVFKVLRELCEKRVLSVLATEAAIAPMHLRKKKTIIFSTKMIELETLADNWMHIGKDDSSSKAFSPSPFSELKSQSPVKNLASLWAEEDCELI
jgi:ABC-type multidrug transport system ATPase subunit